MFYTSWHGCWIYQHNYPSYPFVQPDVCSCFMASCFVHAHTHNVSSHLLYNEFPHVPGPSSDTKMSCPVQLSKFIRRGQARTKKWSQKSEYWKLRLGEASFSGGRKLLALWRPKSVEIFLPSNLFVWLASSTLCSAGCSSLFAWLTWGALSSQDWHCFSPAHLINLQLQLLPTHNSSWIFFNIFIQKQIFS